MSQLPEAVKNCWGQQQTNPKAEKGNWGDKVSVGALRSTHISLGVCLATCMHRDVNSLRKDLKGPELWLIFEALCKQEAKAEAEWALPG